MFLNVIILLGTTQSKLKFISHLRRDHILIYISRILLVVNKYIQEDEWYVVCVQEGGRVVGGVLSRGWPWEPQQVFQVELVVAVVVVGVLRQVYCSVPLSVVFCHRPPSILALRCVVRYWEVCWVRRSKLLWKLVWCRNFPCLFLHSVECNHLTISFTYTYKQKCAND